MHPDPLTGAHPASATPVLAPAEVRINEIPIALVDYTRAIDWIDASIDVRRCGYICVSNVHAVMAAETDRELRGALLESSFNVPDGMPLVWALRLFGHRLSDRVYGPELMARSCARAAISGQRIYLYGGRNEGALVQLTLNLRRRFPGLKIVGGWSPPHRELTSAEDDRVVDEINRVRPDIVWVGIGVPKQEKWMARMRDRLDAPVLIGVGAAFDFHAGLVPQAPRLLQDLGLEWAFRLIQEPRRLWRRYLHYNPRFVVRVAHQLLVHYRSR